MRMHLHRCPLCDTGLWTLLSRVLRLRASLRCGVLSKSPFLLVVALFPSVVELGFARLTLCLEIL